MFSVVEFSFYFFIALISLLSIFSSLSILIRAALKSLSSKSNFEIILCFVLLTVFSLENGSHFLGCLYVEYFWVVHWTLRMFCSRHYGFCPVSKECRFVALFLWDIKLVWTQTKILCLGHLFNSQFFVFSGAWVCSINKCMVNGLASFLDIARIWDSLSLHLPLQEFPSNSAVLFSESLGQRDYRLGFFIGILTTTCFPNLSCPLAFSWKKKKISEIPHGIPSF